VIGGQGETGVSVYLVIFGAAVRADGTPSGTLSRRVTGALSIAREIPNRIFAATGGPGRHGPAEASVIRELLTTAGVDADEILVEDQAEDTLQSVILCHRILRRRSDVDLIIPCSSPYHNLRCALLFRMLGYKVQIHPMPKDRPHLPLWKWFFYVLKEAIALPYDTAMLLFRLISRRETHL
jgi:uncharacterized SAM-binding protein YcdF (DUF218 family)